MNSNDAGGIFETHSSRVGGVSGSGLVGDVRARELFDELADVERVIAVQQARKYRIVEKLHQYLVDREMGLVPEGMFTFLDDDRLDVAEVQGFAERSFVAELAVESRIHERTAETLASHARLLVGEYPATLAALESGVIENRHVTALLDQAVTLPSETRPVFEQQALEKAAVQTPSRFRRTVRELGEQLHPVPLTERVKTAGRRRHIEFTPDTDGMAWLGVYTTGDKAVQALGRIHAHREELLSHGYEERTPKQIDADVATDLLLYGVLDTASGASGSQFTGRGVAPGVRAIVHVTVPVMTLIGESEEPALLEGRTPIDPDTARRLCAGASSFYRILTDPIDGAFLTVGRNSYRPPADLKRYLEIRDGTCRFPGCDRPATRSDLDHTVPWADNGITSADNMAHLCRPHHRLKHNTGWTTTHTGSGTLQWTTPTGNQHTTLPGQPRAARSETNKTAPGKIPRVSLDPPPTPPPLTQHRAT